MLSVDKISSFVGKGWCGCGGEGGAGDRLILWTVVLLTAFLLVNESTSVV
jgi:hypothetical protein